jgi:hypothetical protein
MHTNRHELKKFGVQALACLAILLSVLTTGASETEFLPVEEITHTIPPFGETGKIVVEAATDVKARDGKLTKLRVQLDGKWIEFPKEALDAAPNLNLVSMKVGREKGRDGKQWIEICFEPRGKPEFTTRYWFIIIDGKYSHTSRHTDIPKDGVIHRQSEKLHEAKP